MDSKERPTCQQCYGAGYEERWPKEFIKHEDGNVYLKAKQCSRCDGTGKERDCKRCNNKGSYSCEGQYSWSIHGPVMLSGSNRQICTCAWSRGVAILC